MLTDESTGWKKLFYLIKWTTKMCYILCPPLPNLMIRKAAFHPPKHCHYYFLIGEKVSNLSKKPNESENSKCN